jgi:hypothetical protein
MNRRNFLLSLPFVSRLRDLPVTGVIPLTSFHLDPSGLECPNVASNSIIDQYLVAVNLTIDTPKAFRRPIDHRAAIEHLLLQGEREP